MELKATVPAGADAIDTTRTSNAETTPQPDFNDFMARLDAARSSLPPSPWQTTEEAWHALREGDLDNGLC